MEKQYITAGHFKKLLTSQPFFIWNKLDELKEDTSEPDTLHFWNQVIDESENISYNEVSTRTIERFNKWLRDRIMRDYETVIISGSKEEQIERTKEAMLGKLMIISPVFEYQDAIAQPFAYDPVEREAIYIKYSKKTKVTDMVQPYWDFNIIQKTTQVGKISLYLPSNKKYRKNEIDLRKIDSVHTTKTGKHPFQQNAKGEITDTKIIDFVRKPLLKMFAFPKFDDALNKIKKAKTAQLSEGKIFLDFEQLEQNKYKQELLDHLKFKYAGWNGNIVKKKDIMSFYENGDESVFHSNVLDKIESLSKAEIINRDIVEIENIKKANKVIWYDFEGYSLPYAPLDNVGPHQQLIFQVSVIETVENEEVRKSNVVVDPKKINLDSLFNIIKEVHSDGADAYVVYNKNYELPRMREIIQLMTLEDHPKVAEAQKMYDEIEEKTVDLMNVFKITSKDKLPMVLMHDQNAKASIKNVEKHISNNNIDLPRPIKEYKNLDIQNGGMAMETAIHRSIGLIGDQEWATKVEQLEIYCENDVRAMIMVYDFVIKLMGDNATN